MHITALTSNFDNRKGKKRKANGLVPSDLDAVQHKSAKKKKLNKLSESEEMGYFSSEEVSSKKSHKKLKKLKTKLVVLNSEEFQDTQINSSHSNVPDNCNIVLNINEEASKKIKKRNKKSKKLETKSDPTNGEEFQETQTINCSNNNMLDNCDIMLNIDEETFKNIKKRNKKSKKLETKKSEKLETKSDPTNGEESQETQANNCSNNDILDSCDIVLNIDEEASNKIKKRNKKSKKLKTKSDPTNGEEFQETQANNCSNNDVLDNCDIMLNIIDEPVVETVKSKDSKNLYKRKRLEKKVKSEGGSVSPKKFSVSGIIESDCVIDDLGSFCEKHEKTEDGVRLSYKLSNLEKGSFFKYYNFGGALAKRSYKHMIKGDIILNFNNTNLHDIKGYGCN